MFKRGDGREAPTASWETLGVVVLVVGALALSFVALTNDPAPPSGAAAFDPVETQEPSPTTSAIPTGSSTSQPTPSEDVSAEPPPDVPDRRRVDFTETNVLPDGARTFDNESVSAPLAVQDGSLTHGRPRGPVAVSTLETELDSDVRKVGIRVRFIGDDPGSVVLAAWQDSFITSRLDRAPIPASGLRVVADADSWALTVAPGEDVLASGSFARVQGTQTFVVYRTDSTAWVTDPAGTTTRIQDPRIAELAGAWASWQLLEQQTLMTPAVIEAVWAG